MHSKNVGGSEDLKSAHLWPQTAAARAIMSSLLGSVAQRPTVVWAAAASLMLVLVRLRRQLKAGQLEVSEVSGTTAREPASAWPPEEERREKEAELKRFDTNVRYLAEVPPVHTLAQLTPDSSIGKQHGQRRIKRSMHKKLVVAMVGLPARGKSYIVKMILRYMSFCKGVKGKLFNVGDYRRRHGLAGVSSKFFDGGNEEAMKVGDESRRSRCG
eukprot:scaffold2660_cov257-Pinguiococcus_pyrenoidosus.AAC.19